MNNRTHPIDPDTLRDFGKTVDFSQTATDYATHRAGFPPAFFDLLAARDYTKPGMCALDIGTGTGTVARGLARMGLQVTGLDPAMSLMDQAEQLDRAAGVSVTYLEGNAETLPFADSSLDLITAGQCWHWFDRPAAAAEAARILKPGGRLLIAHFDWLPLPGNVVAATEKLILAFNPDWAGAGGAGLYPDWLSDLAHAGFGRLETVSFDIIQPYSPAAWRGRIRASAGISASLPADEITRFDAALARMLACDFNIDPLPVPHRVWLATGILPII